MLENKDAEMLENKDAEMLESRDAGKQRCWKAEKADTGKQMLESLRGK
jgi:hypothetical protein